MSLAALRQRLSGLVAPPRAGGAAITTGIRALDRALSDGGIPCGRLTEVVGARGSGRTTLVREIVASALAGGRWVAYVDGARTLAPRDWAPWGQTGRLWVIRPPEAARSAWCADVLLRSGAFGLVVLDGGAPLTRPVAVRLTRLAREHDAALVVVSENHGGGTNESRSGAVIGSAVRLRVTRQGTKERVLRIVVDKGGTQSPVEVRCVVEMARRLCTHPEVPDRRGVAARGRWGERASPDVPGARRNDAGHERRGDRSAASTGSGRGAAPRGRRFGEPDVKRDAFLLGHQNGHRPRGQASRAGRSGARSRSRR
ncbi:MAG TPA: hypothetical protein VF178_12810 [Gemmatimonadaceae bacterium]